MSNHTLIISSGFVAGVPHRNPDLSVVAVGDKLWLKPEPENPYDPEAVKLIHVPSGQFLGYIPREQTKAIHLALNQSFEVYASVDLCQPQVKWKELGYTVTVNFNLAS